MDGWKGVQRGAERAEGDLAVCDRLAKNGIRCLDDLIHPSSGLRLVRQ
jgi:hypothetical protein